MQWIDVVLIAVLVCITALAVRHLFKKRGECCGDCASCGRSCAQPETTVGHAADASSKTPD